MYVFDIICIVYHIWGVSWIVALGDEFEPEFKALSIGVRVELLAMARLL